MLITLEHYRITVNVLSVRNCKMERRRLVKRVTSACFDVFVKRELTTSIGDLSFLFYCCFKLISEHP